MCEKESAQEPQEQLTRIECIWKHIVSPVKRNESGIKSLKKINTLHVSLVTELDHFP